MSELERLTDNFIFWKDLDGATANCTFLICGEKKYIQLIRLELLLN